jgi:ligand-binding SRPBCC domain-containing protein
LTGDVVTWSARHFGLPFRLTIRIFDVDAPHSFADEQVRGPFAAYLHEHLFEGLDGRTSMQDRITFTAPFGPLGRLVETLVLRRHMQTLIEERNAALTRAVMEG